jgi:Predicted transcriptional regulators
VHDSKEDPELQEIVERLKSVRINAGLSQAKFAKELGVSQGNVGTWETGGSLPGALALKAIAQKFDCSVDWILTGTDMDLHTQRVEDPDLRAMINVLKKLMESNNPDIRGWAKIQFKRAFSEQSDVEVRNNPNK